MSKSQRTGCSTPLGRKNVAGDERSSLSF